MTLNTEPAIARGRRRKVKGTPSVKEQVGFQTSCLQCDTQINLHGDRTRKNYVPYLIRHAKSHIRRRQYVCSECDHSSIVQYNLHCHIKRLHSGQAVIRNLMDDEFLEEVLSKTQACFPLYTDQIRGYAEMNRDILIGASEVDMTLRRGGRRKRTLANTTFLYDRQATEEEEEQQDDYQPLSFKKLEEQLLRMNAETSQNEAETSNNSDQNEPEMDEGQDIMEQITNQINDIPTNMDGEEQPNPVDNNELAMTTVKQEFIQTQNRESGIHAARPGNRSEQPNEATMMELMRADLVRKDSEIERLTQIIKDLQNNKEKTDHRVLEDRIENQEKMIKHLHEERIRHYTLIGEITSKYTEALDQINKLKETR